MQFVIKVSACNEITFSTTLFMIEDGAAQGAKAHGSALFSISTRTILVARSGDHQVQRFPSCVSWAPCSAERAHITGGDTGAGVPTKPREPCGFAKRAGCAIYCLHRQSGSSTKPSSTRRSSRLFAALVYTLTVNHRPARPMHLQDTPQRTIRGAHHGGRRRPARGCAGSDAPL